MGDKILYSIFDACVFLPLGGGGETRGTPTPAPAPASPLVTARAFKNRLELVYREDNSMKRFD